MVGVRDLAMAGRRTFLHWRNRRFRCEACGQSFAESPKELPPRQRVTAATGRAFFESTRERAAHTEIVRAQATTATRWGARSSSAPPASSRVARTIVRRDGFPLTRPTARRGTRW